LHGAEPVEVAQQSATAGEDDALIDDIRGEFGRRVFQRDA
jgi:hypothetical protein